MKQLVLKLAQELECSIFVIFYTAYSYAHSNITPSGLVKAYSDFAEKNKVPIEVVDLLIDYKVKRISIEIVTNPITKKQTVKLCHLRPPQN